MHMASSAWGFAWQAQHRLAGAACSAPANPQSCILRHIAMGCAQGPSERSCELVVGLWGGFGGVCPRVKLCCSHRGGDCSGESWHDLQECSLQGGEYPAGPIFTWPGVLQVQVRGSSPSSTRCCAGGRWQHLSALYAPAHPIPRAADSVASQPHSCQRLLDS